MDCLRKDEGAPFLDLNEQDALARNIADGDDLKVATLYWITGSYPVNLLKTHQNINEMLN